MRRFLPAGLALGSLGVLGALVWQGVTSAGNPDPLAADLSAGAVVMNTGLIVFREGLEAILVFAAVTASMMGAHRVYRRPITWGAAAAFVASVATWFVVIALLDAVNAPALDIQAATGLLAVVVLLVIMNWFFHKVYWTGWISMHNKRRRRLLALAEDDGRRAAWGFALLGFSVVYREGFEVVLFLQNMRLQAGSGVVSQGVAIGLAFTAVVGVLTFVAHHRLPYKKMLVFTGVMLAGVLIVMVGESVQEMQQASWVGVTPVPVAIPAWMGMWFAVFPTAESLGAQAVAALLVGGSYVVSRYVKVWRPQRKGLRPATRPSAPPVAAAPHRRSRPGRVAVP